MTRAIHVVTHTDIQGDSGQSLRLRHLIGAFSRVCPVVVHACGRGAFEPDMRVEQRPLMSVHDADALRRKAFRPAWMIRVGRMMREFCGAIGRARLLYTDSPLVGFCARLTPGARRVVIEVNGLLSEEWVVAGRVSSRRALRFRMMQRIERAAYRSADTLIAVSGGIEAYLVDTYGVPAERIHVIPNGIDPALLRVRGGRGPLQRLFGHIGDDPVAMFVGGFRPWHGVKNLIQALPAALARAPALRLVLVGDGPLRRAMEAYAEERGLADRVLFTGHRPPSSIPELIAAADVCLYYPSYALQDYGFLGDPLKLREYMAAGKPIVTPRLRHVSDIIETHRCGVVVEEGVDAFGRAVADLVLDPARAAALGANGRRAVMAGYTWPAIAERILGVLHRLEPDLIPAGAPDDPPASLKPLIHEPHR